MSQRSELEQTAAIETIAQSDRPRIEAGDPAHDGTPAARRRRGRRVGGATPYFFVGPAAILFLCFSLVPICIAIVLSFQDTATLGDGEWVGGENFGRMVGDSLFRTALLNTLVFTLGTVPTSMAMGLALAVALNRRIPGRSVLRALFFVPMVAAGVVVGVVMSWIFNGDYGVANNALTFLGLERAPWLTAPGWAMATLILVVVWTRIGFCMVIYLGALQAIPEELKEAAALDGASRWTRFRLVSWPLLRPTTSILLILNVVFSLQAFDVIYVMTGGGPGFSTTVLMQYIFRSAFIDARMGYAAALGGGARRGAPPLHRPASESDATSRGGTVMTTSRFGTASQDALSTRNLPAVRPATSRERTSPRRWLLFAALTALAILMVFPVYWMFVSALTPGGQSQSGSFYLVPSEPTMQNYVEVFATQPVLAWLGNSLFIAGIGTALSVCISLSAGYALAKFRFRGRGLLYALFLVTIMIPIQVTLVPSFLVVARIGLVDSPWAVILPTLFDTVGIFIARQFMLGVPDALMEAARLDGASEFVVFFRVVLPSCGPLVGVLVILGFMNRWNDFLWPLVVLQGNENLTVPVALSTLTTNPAFSSPWGPVMAVATITVIPLLVVFLVFQRQFVQGIASSGIK
ncbi:ABC transporter permease [Microbacterium murale]|uniref:ABC-type sugar transport system permease subunit n=1 Tax=Microbacterium murale TaxID=1081040 RepID=A0ABU0P6P0_9MICO|nr:ABC transporter permease subunit [Microbacterium murale]MDQ0642998.1 ABC-type sugar transport system permease subunit [Microbacterium murale]